MNFLDTVKQEQARFEKSKNNYRDPHYPRYVFSPFIDCIAPMLDAYNRIIPKGMIVPIYRPWRHINIVRENLPKDSLPANYERLLNPNPDPANMAETRYLPIAREYFPAADVCNYLRTEYSNVGAIEIEALAGVDPMEYEKMTLNRIILGIEDENEPYVGKRFSTIRVYRERFKMVLERASQLAGQFSDSAKMIQKVTLEMEAAAEKGFDSARAIAEQANSDMRAQEIKRYTPNQQYAFQFSETVKVDEAIEKMAEMHEEAARRGLQAPVSPFADPGFLEGMKIMAETIGKSVAESMKGATAPVTPAPVVNPQPEPMDPERARPAGTQTARTGTTDRQPADRGNAAGSQTGRK